MSDMTVIPVEVGFVDLGQQRLFGPDTPVHLTSTECKLLRYLAKHAGQTVSREELLVDVWNYSPSSMTRAVDNMIRKLRAKLEVNPKRPQHIFTVHGEGYRLEIAKQKPQPAQTPAPVVARTNLEASGEPFIGRTREMERVLDLCRDRSVVCLIGPSGIGKTRLARRAAIKALDRRQVDSAWMVELADVRTEAGVLQALAHGLMVEPGADGVYERLCTSLARRGPVLLVLDNVEQVAEEISDLLGRFTRAAPEARFVCTTQHRLSLRGVALVSVEPMPLEDSRALFTSRARDAGLLGWDEVPNPTLLDQLLHQLDGVPLAVELAAARMDVLSIGQMVRRTGEFLDLLTDRAPAAERHSTLRAAVAWSWSLLSDSERLALAGCALFEVGFPDTLALALWGEMGLGEVSLSTLAGLVDKSLLRTYTTAPPHEARHFVVYQAIKTFALEQLESSGELDRVRLAHCRAMAGLARDAYDASDSASLAPLAENLIAAFSVALDHGLSEVCSLALGISLTTAHNTDLNRALKLLRQAEEALDDDGLRTEVTIARAAQLAAARRWSDARAVLDSAESSVLQASPPTRVRARLRRAEILRNSARVADAVTLLEEAAGRWESELPAGTAASLRIGWVHMLLNAGRTAEAETRITPLLVDNQHLSLSLRRSIYNAAASMRVIQGRLSDAGDWLDTMATLCSPRGLQYANMLGTRAWCAAELGQTERAVSTAQRALMAARQCGQPGFEAFIHGRLVHALMESDDLEAFDRQCDALILQYTQLQEPVRRALARLNKNIALQRRGDFEGARAQIDVALAEFGDSASRFAAYAQLHDAILHSEVDRKRGAESLETATGVLTEIGSSWDLQLLEVARLHQVLWDPDNPQGPSEVHKGIVGIRASGDTAGSSDLRVALGLLEEAVDRRLALRE